MIVLLNNTILSNFSIVARPDLVRQAFPHEETATVAAVLTEHANGARGGHFAVCDWSWLTVLELTPTEQKELEQMPHRLGHGESACLITSRVGCDSQQMTKPRFRTLALVTGISKVLRFCSANLAYSGTQVRNLG